jgi:hypothetical protein
VAIVAVCGDNPVFGIEVDGTVLCTIVFFGLLVSTFGMFLLGYLPSFD